MPWFLAVVLSVYTGLHLALYFWARPLIPRRRGAGWAVLGWCLVLGTAPVWARILERAGWNGPAGAAAWAGYLWMGLVLVWLLVVAALALPRLGWRLGARRGWWRPGPTARRWAAVSFLAGLAVFGYGFWEARWFAVERVTIPTAKLPAGVERVRVVAVADLHLSHMMDRWRLAEIISLVEAQRPDVIVAVGDIVDGYIPHEDHTARRLAALEAPLGRFAVLGNHERYAGLAYSLAFLHRAGFTVLRQEAANPAGVLALAGVDDPGRGNPWPDEARALEGVRPELFTILLKHRPLVAEASRGRVDLQISGHTHGGQVWPNRYLAGLVYPRLMGLFSLPHGAALYVTRGAGTWGPPLRILTRPEITVLDIVRRPG